MHDLLRKYGFHWEILEIIISGRSVLDSMAGLSGFPMKSTDDADRFIACYGFELEDPIQRAELLGNLHEAVNFIRKYFLYPENIEGLKLDIPRKILEITDIRDLLLMANLSFPGQMNDSAGNQLKSWACAVLKVIHALAHLDKDLRSAYFSEIQKQIFDRYYKLIHRDSAGHLWIGDTADDPLRVNLVTFDTKAEKSRDSIILKLLHKPEITTEEVFDRVGMRFVTHSRLDALRVIKFMKDKMILMPANIKPTRSRNTLFDVSIFKKRHAELMEASRENMSEAQLIEQLEKAMHEQAVSPAGENPHTSVFYRSIQFTTRQLIRLKNPIYDDIRELKNLAKSGELDGKTKPAVDRIDLKFMQREIRFFFPYEIQVLDAKSAEENESGKSAHHEYKRSQISTAMKRVMGSLMDAAR